MAVTVMIIGQSGSGKSTSLRSFGPNDAFVVNVSGKPMPFKNNGLKVWK
jgi:ABC-type phosphate/phosphonate transport system ATPase subunit